MRKRWAETMSNGPWKGLVPSGTPDEVHARRVNAELPWNFFWGIGSDRKYHLLLRHAPSASPTGKLPKLKGVDVELHVRKDGLATLDLTLLETSQWEIFLRLCHDIIDSASLATSEPEAVRIALSRTWRWHHLLRGGTDARLTVEEQKGLIGELLVIERLLVPIMSVADAVHGWRGPFGSPKDFELGTVCVEAKARRGAATPFIVVSSEFQLDDVGVDAVFLYVVDLAQAPEGSGMSVVDVAVRVRDFIWAIDPGEVEMFDRLMEAAGLCLHDDYSDTRWIEGPGRLFKVTDGFPRIAGHQLTQGVSAVRYSVSLSACEPFLVTDASLLAAFQTPSNVY